MTRIIAALLSFLLFSVGNAYSAKHAAFPDNFSSSGAQSVAAALNAALRASLENPDDDGNGDEDGATGSDETPDVCNAESLDYDQTACDALNDGSGENSGAAAITPLPGFPGDDDDDDEAAETPAVCDEDSEEYDEAECAALTSSISKLDLGILSVTYDANGGDETAVPIDTELYDAGDTVTVPASAGDTAMVRDGYTFLGWLAPGGDVTQVGNGLVCNPTTPEATPACTTSTFTMPPVTAPATGVTLYAQWGANIAYAANGATQAPPTDSTLYAEGNLVTVQGQGDLARDGFTFGGWQLPAGVTTTATSANPNSPVAHAGDQFAMPYGPITLTAVWVGTTFTVNDASFEPDDSPGDGQCSTPSGSCTMTAALQELNAPPLPGVNYEFPRPVGAVTIDVADPGTSAWLGAKTGTPTGTAPTVSVSGSAVSGTFATINLGNLTYQAGDMIVMASYRNNATPNSSTNWQQIGTTVAGNNNSLWIGYQIATSSSSATLGTWNNTGTGTFMKAFVLHPSVPAMMAPGAVNFNSGAASANKTFAAFTPTQTTSNIAVRIMGTGGTGAALPTTNNATWTDVTDANGSANISTSTAAAAAFAADPRGVTSGIWASTVFEIVATPLALTYTANAAWDNGQTTGTANNLMVTLPNNNANTPAYELGLTSKPSAACPLTTNLGMLDTDNDEVGDLLSPTPNASTNCTAPATTDLGDTGAYFYVEQPVTIDLGYRLSWNPGNLSSSNTPNSTASLFFFNGDSITLKGLKDSWTSETAIYAGPKASNLNITGASLNVANNNAERLLVIRGGASNITLQNSKITGFAAQGGITAVNQGYAVMMDGSTTANPITGDSGITITNNTFISPNSPSLCATATITSGPCASSGFGVYPSNTVVNNINFTNNTLTNLNASASGTALGAVNLNATGASINGTVNLNNNKITVANNPTTVFNLTGATIASSGVVNIKNNLVAPTTGNTPNISFVSAATTSAGTLTIDNNLGGSPMVVTGGLFVDIPPVTGGTVTVSNNNVSSTATAGIVSSTRALTGGTVLVQNNTFNSTSATGTGAVVFTGTISAGATAQIDGNVITAPGTIINYGPAAAQTNAGTFTISSNYLSMTGTLTSAVISLSSAGTASGTGSTINFINNVVDGSGSSIPVATSTSGIIGMPNAAGTVNIRYNNFVGLSGYNGGGTNGYILRGGQNGTASALATAQATGSVNFTNNYIQYKGQANHAIAWAGAYGTQALSATNPQYLNIVNNYFDWVSSAAATVAGGNSVIYLDDSGLANVSGNIFSVNTAGNGSTYWEESMWGDNLPGLLFHHNWNGAMATWFPAGNASTIGKVTASVYAASHAAAATANDIMPVPVPMGPTPTNSAATAAAEPNGATVNLVGSGASSLLANGSCLVEMPIAAPAKSDNAFPPNTNYTGTYSGNRPYNAGAGYDGRWPGGGTNANGSNNAAPGGATQTNPVYVDVYWTSGYPQAVVNAYNTSVAGQGNGAEIFIGRYPVWGQNNNSGTSQTLAIELPLPGDPRLNPLYGAGALVDQSLALDGSLLVPGSVTIDSSLDIPSTTSVQVVNSSAGLMSVADGSIITAGTILPVGQTTPIPMQDRTTASGFTLAANAPTGPVNPSDGTISGNLRLQTVDPTTTGTMATSNYSRVVSIQGSCAPTMTLERAQYEIPTQVNQPTPTMIRDLHYTLQSNLPLGVSYSADTGEYTVTGVNPTSFTAQAGLLYDSIYGSSMVTDPSELNMQVVSVTPLDTVVVGHDQECIASQLPTTTVNSDGTETSTPYTNDPASTTDPCNILGANTFDIVVNLDDSGYATLTLDANQATTLAGFTNANASTAPAVSAKPVNIVVSGSSAGTTTVSSIPSYQVNDIVVIAARGTATKPAPTTSGNPWTAITTAAASGTNTLYVGYQIVTACSVNPSTNTTQALCTAASGTWAMPTITSPTWQSTAATPTAVEMFVLHPNSPVQTIGITTANATSSSGNINSTATTNTGITYPSVTLTSTCSVTGTGGAAITTQAACTTAGGTWAPNGNSTVVRVISRGGGTGTNPNVIPATQSGWTSAGSDTANALAVSYLANQKNTPVTAYTVTPVSSYGGWSTVSFEVTATQPATVPDNTITYVNPLQIAGWVNPADPSVYNNPASFQCSEGDPVNGTAVLITGSPDGQNYTISVKPKNWSCSDSNCTVPAGNGGAIQTDAAAADAANAVIPAPNPPVFPDYPGAPIVDVTLSPTTDVLPDDDDNVATIPNLNFALGTIITNGVWSPPADPPAGATPTPQYVSDPIIPAGQFTTGAITVTAQPGTYDEDGTLTRLSVPPGTGVILNHSIAARGTSGGSQACDTDPADNTTEDLCETAGGNWVSTSDPTSVTDRNFDGLMIRTLPIELYSTTPVLDLAITAYRMPAPNGSNWDPSAPTIEMVDPTLTTPGLGTLVPNRQMTGVHKDDWLCFIGKVQNTSSDDVWNTSINNVSVTSTTAADASDNATLNVVSVPKGLSTSALGIDETVDPPVQYALTANDWRTNPIAYGAAITRGWTPAQWRTNASLGGTAVGLPLGAGALSNYWPGYAAGSPDVGGPNLLEWNYADGNGTPLATATGDSTQATGTEQYIWCQQVAVNSSTQPGMGQNSGN